MTEHTDKRFAQDLRGLKDEILKMGGIVEEMIALAMKALVERNSKTAQGIIDRDRSVDELEMAIDERCIQLLALHQPAASDLRFITIGLRISKDLERMGDLAVNISGQALDLNREPQLKPYVDLPRMAAKTQWMVREVLDAFVERDADRAAGVCKIDDEVDDLNDQVFQELVGLMEKDSTAVTRAVRLILVSRHLERIADHATNIAEEVVFMVQGKDIRHGKQKTMEPRTS